MNEAARDVFYTSFLSFSFLRFSLKQAKWVLNYIKELLQ